MNPCPGNHFSLNIRIISRVVVLNLPYNTSVLILILLFKITVGCFIRTLCYCLLSTLHLKKKKYTLYMFMSYLLAVHGGWVVWGTWGTCSSSCGIGLRRRDRACDSPWKLRESLSYEICSDYQCKYHFTYL